MSDHERAKKQLEIILRRKIKKKKWTGLAKYINPKMAKHGTEFAKASVLNFIALHDSSYIDGKPWKAKGVDKKKAFYNSKAWRVLRKKVLDYYGEKCMKCGKTREDGVYIHVDHIRCRRRFPELELEFNNMQVLCEDCNMEKGTDFADYRPKRTIVRKCNCEKPN